MGKTRDLVRKTGDIKGIFHERMCMIKDRNCKDNLLTNCKDKVVHLTEAEEIKKRWQEYTEETRKNSLNDPDNHSEVVTHLEPDIFEFEVSCVLGSITINKAGGGDGITAQLFQILKDDAVKVLNVLTANWKTHQWPQNWKRSVFIRIPKKDNAKKNVQTTTQLLSFHMLAR